MTRIMTLGIIAAGLLFVSCDKYEDGRPSGEVRAEFSAMYPDAKDVEWDRERTFWSVSFETGSLPNRVEHEAYFDQAGNWVMTKTEMLLTAVPQSVKDALAANVEYGNLPFRDNDADKYQMPSGVFYRFDLTKDGREVEVDVNENGAVSSARYDLF